MNDHEPHHASQLAVLLRNDLLARIHKSPTTKMFVNLFYWINSQGFQFKIQKKNYLPWIQFTLEV